MAANANNMWPGMYFFSRNSTRYHDKKLNLKPFHHREQDLLFGFREFREFLQSSFRYSENYQAWLSSSVFRGICLATLLWWSFLASVSRYRQIALTLCSAGILQLFYSKGLFIEPKGKIMYCYNFERYDHPLDFYWSYPTQSVIVRSWN